MKGKSETKNETLISINVVRLVLTYIEEERFENQNN